MKATIDIPEDLYRRVKARTAEEGLRIREVTVELFRKWLDGPDNASGCDEVPLVDPSRLARHRDAASLRQNYPRGYRLSGPLSPARPGAPAIGPAEVEQAMEKMDQQELAAHASAR